MSYDEKLAGRVRWTLAARPGRVGKAVTERKMFGGLAFLLDRAMCCGILGRELVVRVGRERYGDALGDPHARPMDFTGRPLTGYVYVAPAGLRGDASLAKWIDWGIETVSSLGRPSARPKPLKTPK